MVYVQMLVNIVVLENGLEFVFYFRYSYAWLSVTVYVTYGEAASLVGSLFACLMFVEIFHVDSSFIRSFLPH